MDNVSETTQVETKESKKKLTLGEVKARRQESNRAYYESHRVELIKSQTEKATQKRIKQRLAEGRDVSGPLKAGRKPLLISSHAEPVMNH